MIRLPVALPLARPLVLGAFLCALAPVAATAQGYAPSSCRLVAERIPEAHFAALDGGEAASPSLPVLFAAGPAPALDPLLAQGPREEVRITFAHHATYLIESPEGVVAATDYSGYAGPGIVPDLVTMNRAHSTHHTDFPDPAIGTVLRGWGENGEPARHAETIRDLYVRNVTTDIMRFGTFEADANSIFIFEVAGLCIGHLGHLHHELSDGHYAEIGRLDIVMVPVDGGYTMSQEGVGEIAARLRASIVLPMHRFAGPIERFLDRLPDFAVERHDGPSITVSLRTLPGRPTVVILEGV